MNCPSSDNGYFIAKYRYRLTNFIARQKLNWWSTWCLVMCGCLCLCLWGEGWSMQIITSLSILGSFIQRFAIIGKFQTSREKQNYVANILFWGVLWCHFKVSAAQIHLILYPRFVKWIQMPLVEWEKPIARNKTKWIYRSIYWRIHKHYLNSSRFNQIYGKYMFQLQFFCLDIDSITIVIHLILSIKTAFYSISFS